MRPSMISYKYSRKKHRAFTSELFIKTESASFISSLSAINSLEQKPLKSHKPFISKIKPVKSTLTTKIEKPLANPICKPITPLNPQPPITRKLARTTHLKSPKISRPSVPLTDKKPRHTPQKKPEKQIEGFNTPPSLYT
ncbi:hypothetical protein M440DRAFT_1008475 [Trichoderma longibrachiatum ATCC 18648]|uniref:Uncharacterized protein n=1 Tax=Trichoderma longibrachiatum ATCC 18648 TaxID=983965 RepID=A0A2T4CHV6_TRILO|nr:hypothetical protein M440DRAFT_1008475 [Trichoderma longibrachiatum ATCC 18648]